MTPKMLNDLCTFRPPSANYSVDMAKIFHSFTYPLSLLRTVRRSLFGCGEAHKLLIGNRF